MDRIIIFTLLALLLSSCAKDNAGQVENELSILSLNAFLLDTPDLTAGPSCESECIARAESICAVITNNFDRFPDLLFFQEVFEEDACASLRSCLMDMDYAFHSPCLERDTSWANTCLIKSSKSSGLYLASRRALNDYTFQSFTDCNGCLLQGADCQANKGFQYANIDIEDNCKLHIINTHLDAGDRSNDEAARSLQVQQIADFILGLNVDEKDLIIYGGDLNTTTLGELLEVELRLSANSLNKDVATSLSGRVFDHILLPASATLSGESISLAQTCNPDCTGWFDSDHIGIIANVKYQCL